MCVILVKERGIELPTKGVLESCWKRNPDLCLTILIK